MDRFDYDEYEIKTDLGIQWEQILQEYGNLERSSEIDKKTSENGKLLIRKAQYLNEIAMINSISLNPRNATEFVNALKMRGYKFKNHYTDILDYYEDVKKAGNRVHHHVPFIQMMEAEINKGNEENKNSDNPFDKLMAWVMSHNINVDENISVKRYSEVKKIINERNKQGGSDQQGRIGRS